MITLGSKKDWQAFGLFLLVWLLTSGFFAWRTVVRVQHPKPPICKICHCGKTSCHQECGAENMCVMRCEGLCQKKK